MIELPRAGSDTTLFGDFSGKSVQTGTEPLQDRSHLLLQVNTARQEQLPERQLFLVVINIADTKRYDEIIRIFGYKFADDLLSIRLADLEFISRRQPAFHVGFWSVGLIFRARDVEDYEAALARLISVLAKPVICRGIPVSIKAGIGVCDLMKGSGAAEDLLQATFLAGQAGAVSPAGWTECKYDLADDHRRAFSLISHASHSLSLRNEFELSYQARVDLKTWQCNAAEAFLRWRHPTLGLVMPDEFVPLIEMTGLIRELTFWVLTHAVAQTAKWHAAGHKLKICVNISPANLDEEDLVQRIAALLETYRLAPGFLELEFSERRSFTNLDVARTRMREIRELGVGISIDNYGSGTNGFSSLENVPASMIKIDRRLVNSVVDYPRQQALVKSIIRMAHELDMHVVAEGLETPRTLEMLQAWNCDSAQGFFINRPMPADAFIAWYSQQFAVNEAR